MVFSSPLSIVVGILAIVVALVLTYGVLYAALPWIIQPLMRGIIRLRYRVRVVGRENVPATGPALVASNHLSWLDGFLIAAFAPRNGRAMVNASLVSGPIIRPLALRAGIIPTPWSGPRAIRAALDATRTELDRGQAVAIFPEGQISRHGLTNPFQRGIEAILKGKEGVAVVPAGLDGLWGSNFTYSGGHFYKKWPKGLRRTIAISFGPPLTAPVTAFEVRQAVQEQMVRARELLGPGAIYPETLDLNLPRWEHPSLGLLTASARDVVVASASVNQSASREGSVGLTIPGVALRVVDAEGRPLPPDQPGRIEARLAGHPGWEPTGRNGRIDRDGYVFLDA